MIGNRSLGKTPEEVERNARGLISGLREGGMGSCGKHFPGHGWAEADSHVALPADEREREKVLADLDIYRGLASELTSLMTAHVAYEGFDGETATFSQTLLKEILRDAIGFTGLVFSDDLSMKGAGSSESVAARARRALSAGCDMVLHCNHPEEADEILRDLEWERPERFTERLAGLLPDSGTPLGLEALRSTERWKEAVRALRAVDLL